MFRVFYSVLLVFLASAGTVRAEELHSRHCLHGCPAGAPSSNDVIVREIYVLSSNDATKFADWVAYRVTAATIGSSKTRNWKADPLLAENETLEPEDYDDASAALKIDRGHQVPLASFTGTTHWRDTNYLSNITPQSSALNQGPWKRLEGAVRKLARARAGRAVYVMTGTLNEKVMKGMPKADEPHKVPSGYWKIVAVEEQGHLKVAAFIFGQDTPRSDKYCGHIETVREVEKRSKLNFFHALSVARQDDFETKPATLKSELGC